MIAALTLALGAGGCSTSMPLAAFLPGPNDDKVADAPKADFSGTIPIQRAGLESMAMTNADWLIAKAALRDALGRKQDGASIAWENPITRSRGTVTPVSEAFLQNGLQCRNFLVSHLRNEHESWHEGMACRTQRGEWDIRSARALNKT